MLLCSHWSIKRMTIRGINHQGLSITCTVYNLLYGGLKVIENCRRGLLDYVSELPQAAAVLP